MTHNLLDSKNIQKAHSKNINLVDSKSTYLVAHLKNMNLLDSKNLHLVVHLKDIQLVYLKDIQGVHSKNTQLVFCLLMSLVEGFWTKYFLMPSPSLLYCPHNSLKPCQKQSAALLWNSPAPSCHNTPKLLQSSPAMLLLICTKLAYKSCTSKAMKIEYPNYSNLICFPP